MVTDSLRLKPGDPDALRDRGHYYLNLGRVDLGLADLRNAESLKKNDRGIYYHLGMAYYLSGDDLDRLLLFKGDRTEAEVVKTATAEGALSEATVGYRIGLWHLLNGRRGPAVEWFERAVASGYTTAWGYRASEAELRRLR